MDGYWQDVGNLDQYRQANVDALDGRVDLAIPGLLVQGNVWLGDGVDLDDLAMDAIRGPAVVGNYCKLGHDAQIGPHTVLASSVTVRDGAVVTRSVVDTASHLAGGVRVEGAVVGRSCVLQARARLHEGVALGDEVTLGRDTEVLPDVRIYPFKNVEAGTQVDRNLVWESRAASARLFVQDGLSGHVNVDLTPDVALRLGTALGTALRRGDRVVASRGGSRSAELVAQATLAGIVSTGIDVVDLGLNPASLARHGLRTQGYRAGLHVRAHPKNPEVIEINLFEAPGVQLGAELHTALVRHFSRQEFRRASHDDIGMVTQGTRVAEAYVSDLVESVDAQRIRNRGFRVVVEYAHSSAALVTPLVLGALGVEVVASRAEVLDQTAATTRLASEATVVKAQQLVGAVRADLAVALDSTGERITLIDERGTELPHWQALLLMTSLVGASNRHGTIIVPATTTSHVDAVAEGTNVERIETSLAALTHASAKDGVVFAGAGDGTYIFPRFLPAPAASASIAMLLDLLATQECSVSDLVRELPATSIIHQVVGCPWNAKGALMRLLAEDLKSETPELTDGIRINYSDSWVQVIPDGDEPVVHVYTEAQTSDAASALEGRLVGAIEATLSRIAERPSDSPAIAHQS